MNQKKMGNFLKELRKEKNITQEQLGEKLFVSGRTVSRWETGNIMPDLSILVELADFYDVDIREIINGERKREKMENELKETLEMVAEYSNDEKKKMKVDMIGRCIAAAITLLYALILNATKGFKGSIEESSVQTAVEVAIICAMNFLVFNALYLAGILDKVREWSRKTFRKQ